MREEERDNATTNTTPKGGTPRRGLAMSLLAVCAFVLFYVSPWFPEINNPNENVRLYMTAALVEEGTYRIDTIRERWGWVNDAACVDADPHGELHPCESRRPAPGIERAYYSVKAPGTSLLGVPAYALYHPLSGGDPDQAVATWILRVSATGIPFFIFLVFFYRWLGTHTRSDFLRETVLLSAALGSVLLGYSYLFASHTTSAVTAFGAFMLLYDARRERAYATRWWVAPGAGFLAAMATALEYPCFFVTLTLCIYALFALRSPSRIALFALGALLPTIAVAHFQWAAFGDPLSPGHLFVETPSLRAGHEEGFFGASRFNSEAAKAFIWDRRVGLVVMTPLTLLAPIGLGLLLRSSRARLEGAVVTLLCGATYFAICLMNNWSGGWSLGPRYLVVLIPFLLWAALIALDRGLTRAPRVTKSVALGGLVASLAIAGTLSVYYPHIPDDISHPLRDLLPAIWHANLAPHTLLSLVGARGNLTMLPLAAAFVLACMLPLRHLTEARTKGRDVALVLAGAALFATLFIGYHLVGQARAASDERAIVHVLRTWSPR